MNPKLLLEELDKRFSTQDNRFDNLERQFTTNANACTTYIQVLEKVVQVFDGWRPDIEGIVDDLK
ncbi:unnamed protein product [Miscanthus lutarioriparius]|uniref:Uncharacterized protein n=1 Tax=Miscanthus lutarioriparius TaxID=422564 RepID=A0A811PLP6_9POAL|nr:unnamed protein product [Miscanthus lutarioriparius]